LLLPNAKLLLVSGPERHGTSFLAKPVIFGILYESRDLDRATPSK
jgi:hypothetical protein